MSLHAADEEGIPEAELGDSIEANLNRSLFDEWSNLTPLENWRKINQRILDKMGFAYAATYHTVGMTSLLGDGADSALGGDFTLQGRWDPFMIPADSKTELQFRIRHRHAIGGTAPSELFLETGSLWAPVKGFTDAGFEVPDLYMQYHSPYSGILVRYGQMAIDNQFDDYRMRGAKQSFLNYGFSSNPAVAFPRFGAGVTMRRDWENGIDFTIGGSTVQGAQQGDQVNFDFGSGDLFVAAQIGWDLKLNDRKSRLQFMGWHSDAVSDTKFDAGHGFALTYEQNPSDNEPYYFARLAWAEGEATLVDLYMANGVGVRRGENDIMGAAIGVGRGNESDGDIQGVLELFYRWEPRESIRISPDLQLLFGEGFEGSPGMRFIAGVRCEIAF